MPPSERKEVRVVLAIMHRNDHILLLQRKHQKALWDKKWEFPGGKIDDGESSEQALKREVREETGLAVDGIALLGTHDHDWIFDDGIVTVHLQLFTCEAGEGDVQIEDRSAYGYAWVRADEVLAYDCHEPNLVAFQRLYKNKELHCAKIPNLGGN